MSASIRQNIKFLTSPTTCDVYLIINNHFYIMFLSNRLTKTAFVAFRRPLRAFSTQKPPQQEKKPNIIQMMPEYQKALEFASE